MIKYTTKNVQLNEEAYEEITLHMSYLDSLGSIIKSYNAGDIEQHAVQMVGNTQKALTECVLKKLFPNVEDEENLSVEEVINKEIRILIDFAELLNSLGGHEVDSIVNEIGNVITIIAETAHIRLIEAVSRQKQE